MKTRNNDWAFKVSAVWLGSASFRNTIVKHLKITIKNLKVCRTCVLYDLHCEDTSNQHGCFPFKSGFQKQMVCRHYLQSARLLSLAAFIAFKSSRKQTGPGTNGVSCKTTPEKMNCKKKSIRKINKGFICIWEVFIKFSRILE